MKKLLGIIVLGLFCQTKALAIEMSMFLNTHLKCDMIERTIYWSNSNSVDETDEIKELHEDYNPIFISFDKNWGMSKNIHKGKIKRKWGGDKQVLTVQIDLKRGEAQIVTTTYFDTTDVYVRNYRNCR